MQQLTSGQTAGGALPPSHRLSLSHTFQGAFGSLSLLYKCVLVLLVCQFDVVALIVCQTDVVVSGPLQISQATRGKRGLKIRPSDLRRKNESPSPQPGGNLLLTPPTTQHILSLFSSLQFSSTFKVLFSAFSVRLPCPLSYVVHIPSHIFIFLCLFLETGDCYWDLKDDSPVAQEKAIGGIALVEGYKNWR